MTDYKGPSAATMIKSHTLAAETMSQHNDPCPIFDASALALPQRFCIDPSRKDAILRDRDMVDEPGDAPGTRANAKWGSLAGYAIARHGTETPVLEGREIEALRKWFESGAADAVVEEHMGV